MKEVLREIEIEIDVHLERICAYVGCGLMTDDDLREWLTEYFDRSNKLEDWFRLYMWAIKES